VKKPTHRAGHGWRPSDFRPWGRNALIIPPDSAGAWIQLAMWEIWMGMLVCLTLGGGILFIISSPDRIIAVADLTNCYGPPPVALPCERMLYRGGALDAAFSVLCGVMLIGVAAWFLWELWSVAEPRPITDDFLRLLDDSFGHDWRNPLKWPWARLLWAYGFTVVGAAVTAGLGVMIWTLVVSSAPVKAPSIRIEQNFRVSPNSL
jgi:hypothetical protein